MKRLLPFLPIFLFFLAGCHNKAVMAELDEMKAGDELADQNQALVEKYIGYWNSRDFSSLDELLDPGVKIYVPSTSDQPMSLDDYRGWFQGIYQRFPDISYEIKDVFAVDDKVCLWWVCDATLPGADPDSPDAGKRLSVGAIEIYVIKDGRIIEERTEVDGLGWQQQLGYKLVPNDDSN